MSEEFGDEIFDEDDLTPEEEAEIQAELEEIRYEEGLNPETHLTCAEARKLGLGLWLNGAPVRYTRTKMLTEKLNKGQTVSGFMQSLFATNRPVTPEDAAKLLGTQQPMPVQGKAYESKPETLTPEQLNKLPEHPWLEGIEDWLTGWSENAQEAGQEAAVARMLSTISKHCLPRYTLCKAHVGDDVYHRYDTFEITDQFDMRSLLTGEANHEEMDKLEADISLMDVGTTWFIWRIARLTDQDVGYGPSFYGGVRDKTDYRFIIVVGEDQGATFDVENIFFVRHNGLKHFLKRSWLTCFGPDDGQFK